MPAGDAGRSSSSTAVKNYRRVPLRRGFLLSEQKSADVLYFFLSRRNIVNIPRTTSPSSAPSGMFIRASLVTTEILVVKK
jgi:hypothetical protein